MDAGVRYDPNQRMIHSSVMSKDRASMIGMLNLINSRKPGWFRSRLGVNLAPMLRSPNSCSTKKQKKLRRQHQARKEYDTRLLQWVKSRRNQANKERSKDFAKNDQDEKNQGQAGDDCGIYVPAFLFAFFRHILRKDRNEEHPKCAPRN